MKQKPPGRNSSNIQLTSFQNICAKAGLKVTHQRLQIYDEMVQADDHPTAETLFERLRKTMPTLSLDTVYRTLATLEQHQLIKRVKTDRYKARYEAKMNRHHHFICQRCAAITDFSWSAFDKDKLPADVQQLGTIIDHSITVSGICRKCSTLPIP
jgi:Fur family peroxide stress response transcriptional regulator